MRQRYSPEFKAEAVKLVLEYEYRGYEQTMSDVSRNLKISIKTLSNWVSRARNGKFAAIPSNPSTFALAAEVKRLKKALAVAEMARKILKKAAAYFAKDVLRK